MDQIRVLVVEDEDQFRGVLEEALQESEFKVVSVGSAEEALETLNSETFQLFFLDLQLPGMNGIDLCRRIKASNPIALCFAMTGYASVFHLVECREAGFDDYYVKPFKLEELLESANIARTKIVRWRRMSKRRKKES